MTVGPIRVVHVITRMILGGAQENTLHTCDGLNASGQWDVTLLTGPPLGPEGELLSDVHRLGIDCRVLSGLRRNVNPPLDLQAFRQLKRAFNELKPTIVHTHSSKAGVLGRIAARHAGIPVIVHTVEGLPFHRFSSPLRNFLYIRAERLAARHCDHIACVAEAMIEQIVAAGVTDRSKTSTIYSGMDVDSYLDARPLRESVRARYGLNPQDVVIGKIARLFELKGHEFVIQAAPRVIDHCPDARFLFVGDGILRQQLESQIEQAGLQERFVFTGLVPPEDIPGLVSAMDIVVHASLREGLARVLVQGLLCEKPVVTYAVDGAHEVIIPKETGYLVAPKSVDGLADALIDAFQNFGEARAMAAEGRRRFADRFRIETMVQETEQLYRRLMAEKGLL